EGVHLGVTLVTVLGTPEVTAIRLGVFEESDEVADAHDADTAKQALVVVGQGREHHVATIRSAVNDDPVLIQVRLGGNPVQQGTDVAYGILAEHAVVELQVGLAVATGAPDV